MERLRQPPSISAEVEKIKEQISENKNVSVDMEKLQPLYETLKKRGEEMIARSEGTDKDISAKGNNFRIRKQLNFTFRIILNNSKHLELFWCLRMVQLHNKMPEFRPLGLKSYVQKSLVNVFLCYKVCHYAKAMCSLGLLNQFFKA